MLQLFSGRHVGEWCERAKDRIDDLTKVEAVQTQIDALNVWIAELGENFDDDLGRVVPFDYSAELTAAMDLHGISDPNTAWAVFSERAEALTNLRERL